MHRAAVAASLLLALTALTAAAQETVLLRVSGQPGQFNRYQSGMDMFMRGGPFAAMASPDTTLPTMRMTTFVTRATTGVSGDTLTVSETIDSARMESPAMPQMSGMFGAMAAGMSGSVTTTQVDTRGRIFSTLISNPNMPAAGAPRGGMSGGARPMFLLPANAVRVGDSWTDSMATPATETDPATNAIATYRLERLEQRGGTRLAVVSVNGNIALATTSGQRNLTMTGEFQLDVTGRRIASVAVTMAGIMAMEQMGDVPVRMVLSQSLIP